MAKTKINNRHALTWAVVGWLLEPGTKVFWSTHGYVNTQLAFNEVLYALRSTGVHIERASDLIGAEQIRLGNGSRIVFGARTSDSGRGLSADKLVLDQAYQLTDSQLACLLPVAVSLGTEVVYSQTKAPKPVPAS